MCNMCCYRSVIMLKVHTMLIAFILTFCSLCHRVIIIQETVLVQIHKAAEAEYIADLRHQMRLVELVVAEEIPDMCTCRRCFQTWCCSSTRRSVSAHLFRRHICNTLLHIFNTTLINICLQCHSSHHIREAASLLTQMSALATQCPCRADRMYHWMVLREPHHLSYSYWLALCNKEQIQF